MQAVVFCGVQASGKSAFYVERFFRTHVRINLDMLRTRRRERVLLQACLEAGQRFVVDNTNPTASDRRRYVEPARAAGFELVAYWFDCSPEEAIARNKGRPRGERVPAVAIRATHKRLEPPAREEGFDAVYRVRTDSRDRFRAQRTA